MRKIASFLFSFVAVLVFAQKTITGKVVDSDGESIPSASITISSVDNNGILAYGISNAKGEFKLTFTTNAPSVEVKIRAFNQKSFSKNIKNEDNRHTFTLESDATMIKEVKLKTKLITKKGDTITYDLKSFENKADRTLADVIKKLPGVEVKSDGSILYQGEPLGKFMVNGKDLMEGGYGVINKSLPKDAVSKVEILENHQPIKILEDKVPSDKATMNIKLKKSVTITGRGEVGVGFSPLLWNVKLTPMFFGQKNQWVVNYKANNNGENVQNEGNILAFGNRWEGRRGQASSRSWIGINAAATPSVPEKRYLLNNVHYLSANLLTNPFNNKDWELKINASYANNAIERSSYSETKYDANSTVFPGATYSRFLANNFYNNHAKGELIFQKNAKKGFFKNITSWNNFWNDANNITNIRDEVSNNPYDIQSDMHSPTGSFSNSLSTIIPWGDRLVNFMSYLSYQKDRQRATSFYDNYTDLNQDLELDKLTKANQNITLKTIQANHSASVGLSYKKWTITPEMGINLNFNDMNSLLYISGEKSGNVLNEQLMGKNFQNNFSWSEVNPYTQVGFNYQGGALRMNINLPMNFYGINYKDFAQPQYTRDRNVTAFTPSVWGSYDFASYFKFWGNASINRSFGDFGDMYSGYMLTSPQVLQNNNSPLPETKSYNAGGRLEYRNPLNNLFFNVRYGYSQRIRNLISNTTPSIFGGGITEMIEYENRPQSQSQGAEIGKYFPKFKTNASVSFSNALSNSFSQLSSVTYETKTNTQTLGAKVNNTFFSWLSVDYNLGYNWYTMNNIQRGTSQKTSSWSHNLVTYIYPSANHTLGFYWDNNSFEQNGEIRRNSFFDVSYQFTWTKKKIDFEVKWLNLANTKAYETISYNATLLATSRSTMYIRPRQLMFTVKFNFK